MSYVPNPPDSDGAATSEPALEPSGEPSSLAVTEDTPNGSVPRPGRPYPRDYGALLGRPYPPQGTFGGDRRASRARPRGWRHGPGPVGASGLAGLFAGPLTLRSATGRGVPRAVGAARGLSVGVSSWVLRWGGRRRPSSRL